MADTATTTSRRGLCVADFPDLARRAQAASILYAGTNDGGHPGTAAARAYRSECDSVWAEFSARLVAIVRFANGVPA